MEQEQINCAAEGCGGVCDLEIPITLRTGCISFTTAYPCKQCGRVHNGLGDPVIQRSGARVFLKDGEIVYED